MADEQAERWRKASLAVRETARHLRERDDFRSCVSRAYYAVYQAATSVCLIHGDQKLFPNGWNNPSHEQLPELIKNNGDLPVHNRRVVLKLLRLLRTTREDADYRLGRTVDKKTAYTIIRAMDTVFNLLEIYDD